MKALLLCLVLSVAYGLQISDKVTPIAKVIEMLKGMKEKGQKEKADEVETFTQFAAWCHDVDLTKNMDIKAANAKIDGLAADIDKFESDIARLNEEISSLDGDVATWEQDRDAATKLRNQEHADYEATHKDYSESIDALERAIQVLKKQDYNREQAAALLQEVALLSHVPASAKRVITAFLAQDSNTEGFMDYQAPESAAYEFQSGGIIDMLEKLRTKFGDELAQLEKEESNAQHAYKMLAQDLTNQIDNATNSRNEKASAKASAEQALAEAKADLQETTASRDADQKYLDETNAICAQKTSEYEARQQLRQQELEAIQQAIDIISQQVAGLGEKHLPGLVQTAFVQLRSGSTSVYQSRAASFIKSKAQALNSRVLFQLAEKMQDDPFKKVKAMIQDLINRLMEEANEEAEHKGWCDTELATNEQTRNTKTQEINDLTASIDKMTADIAELTQGIADLNQEITELDAAVAEATAVRQKEHATNTETIQDAVDAQAAVSQALTILKQFYASAAEATALNQADPTKDMPSTWTTEYHGMQGAAGGVVGMLEVIESDFARLETETKADEESAAKQYKAFMEESAITKTAKTKDVEYKTLEKQNLEGKLATAKTDRENTQKELDAALAYYEKLKPSCVDAGVSYEDRVARRKEEIESLQQALRILNGDDIAV